MLNPTSTAKGFTDHEHLDSVGLIHMNGRVYDPELGRFMSADPFVQAPYNSQSYNRYSYVFNSPLSFTDPSGYLSVSGFDYDTGVEEVPVHCDSACMEKHRKQQEAQQDAINQSNIANWRASENRGEQWSYMNGAAYNIANFWGYHAFALAAGGSGSKNNGSDFSHDQRLANLLKYNMVFANAMTIGSNDGVPWAVGQSVDQFTKVAGAIALSPLAIHAAGTSAVTAGRFGPYIARLPTGKPFTSIKDFGKYLIGKPYPTRVGYMGRQQPYNPAKGRYLSFSANPGFANSPLGRFGAGVG
ncbi:MAG: RHS repeat-associated core domain-containing protein [Pseudomonadota bacterium]|nr:RHS repeat-associated core domain-containing protein [Pseudomonadota bacterium]